MIDSLVFRQNLYCFLVVGLCYFLLSLVAPQIQYKPHGMAIPNVGVSLPSPTTPSQVRLLERAPYGADFLGQVILEYSLQGYEETDKNLLINHAKQLVAQLGGNALLLKGYGSKGKIVLLTGEAVRI